MEEDLRKSEELVLLDELEDARDQEDGAQPSPYKSSEEHPTACQAYGETKASQPDGESSTHICGHHTEPDVPSAHPSSTDIIVIHILVLAHEVEPHTQHGK
jgi:hypothetical protein